MTGDIQAQCMSAARRIAQIPPLTSLADKVRASHTALIVIDMPSDFYASEGFMAKGPAFWDLLKAIRRSVHRAVSTGLSEYAALPRYREWLPSNLPAAYRFLKQR